MNVARVFLRCILGLLPLVTVVAEPALAAVYSGRGA